MFLFFIFLSRAISGQTESLKTHTLDSETVYNENDEPVSIKRWVYESGVPIIEIVYSGYGKFDKVFDNRSEHHLVPVNKKPGESSFYKDEDFGRWNQKNGGIFFYNNIDRSKATMRWRFSPLPVGNELEWTLTTLDEYVYERGHKINQTTKFFSDLGQWSADEISELHFIYSNGELIKEDWYNGYGDKADKLIRSEKYEYDTLHGETIRTIQRSFDVNSKHWILKDSTSIVRDEDVYQIDKFAYSYSDYSLKHISKEIQKLSSDNKIIVDTLFYYPSNSDSLYIKHVIHREFSGDNIKSEVTYNPLEKRKDYSYDSQGRLLRIEYTDITSRGDTIKRYNRYAYDKIFKDQVVAIIDSTKYRTSYEFLLELDSTRNNVTMIETKDYKYTYEFNYEIDKNKVVVPKGVDLFKIKNEDFWIQNNVPEVIHFDGTYGHNEYWGARIEYKYSAIK